MVDVERKWQDAGLAREEGPARVVAAHVESGAGGVWSGGDGGLSADEYVSGLSSVGLLACCFRICIMTTLRVF